MIKLNSNNDAMIKLYRNLENILQNIKRKGINYLIQIHGEQLASIDLKVNTSRGVAMQTIILDYDSIYEKWKVYDNGEITYLDSFKEIIIITKDIIKNLRIIAYKF